MSKFSVGDILNMADGQKTAQISPVVSISYVQAGDIGVDYVAGSEGQVKEIIEYMDLSKTVILSTTTLTYTDATYPTKATEITVI